MPTTGITLSLQAPDFRKKKTQSFGQAAAAGNSSSSSKSLKRSGSREGGSRTSNSEVPRSQRPPDLNLAPADDEVTSPLKYSRDDLPPSRSISLVARDLFSLEGHNVLAIPRKRKSVRCATRAQKGGSVAAKVQMIECSNSPMTIAISAPQETSAPILVGSDGVEGSGSEGVKKQKKEQFIFNAASAEAAM